MNEEGPVDANVDVKPLLEAVQRKGGYNSKPVSEAQRKIELLRQRTEWTGEVTQVQLDNLKFATMLISHSLKVVLEIDGDNKTVRYSYEKTKNTPKKSDIATKMQQTLAFYFGNGWVAVPGDVNDPARKTRPVSKRTTAKSKGSRRTAKARGRKT